MSNVIKFGKNKKDKYPNGRASSSTHQFTLNVYSNEKGKFEVEMEVDENVTEFEVWIALLCVAAKMEAENDFEEEEIEMDEKPKPANNPKGPVN